MHAVAAGRRQAGRRERTRLNVEIDRCGGCEHQLASPRSDRLDQRALCRNAEASEVIGAINSIRGD